jgi:hypothetical protein
MMCEKNGWIKPSVYQGASVHGDLKQRFLTMTRRRIQCHSPGCRARAVPVLAQMCEWSPSPLLILTSAQSDFHSTNCASTL